jgi:hypothetical protein
MGIPAQVVNDIASEPILRVLHLAMTAHKAKDVSKKTVKKDLKAKKIVKSSTAPEALRQGNTDAGKKKALNKLRSTGTIDDATDAFMAKWK